ncbi:SnoaL-like domain-containing protein [Rhizoctonia solani]|nr:SnoaL-like domain-containing protein [Rhizoctonia solani]
MGLEDQATELRAELAALKRDVDVLRSERDVARMLNQYVYVHDEAFSPVSRKSEELDHQFEAFFTDDGVCDAFGVHTTREGKAEWVRSVLSSQGNIIGMQMVTSNILIDILDDGVTANARTSAVTTIAGEGQDIRDHHRAAGYYTYRLRKARGEWKIAHLKWHGLGLESTTV